jgi:hypothetical protein
VNAARTDQRTSKPAAKPAYFRSGFALVTIGASPEGAESSRGSHAGWHSPWLSRCAGAADF